jgi:hypothetical protein
MIAPLPQTPRLSSAHSARFSRAAALPCWRRWLVVFALICTVGLYSDALTHHHETNAQRLSCPVCHVAGHNGLEVFTPPRAPALDSVSTYLLYSALDSGIVRRFAHPVPHSRAPPA